MRTKTTIVCNKAAPNKMMLEYLKSLSADQIEGVKFALVILWALSTIGVCIGVGLEKKRDLAWKILVVSLVLELIFGITIYLAGSEISKRQKAELLEARRQTANRNV